MFGKILVPLDGSELAAKVLPTVVEMAKKFNSLVTVLHVCHTEGPGVGEASPGVAATAAAAEQKVCEAFLSQVGKDLQGQGLNVNWVCAEGVPAREIIGYAAKNNYDLICMATHGKGEVAWVLGSTAERVVTHATVPVLLVRVMEFKPPVLKEEFFL
uniref:Universal stress protein n=1 Tax=Desulfobacca acetoxidans TaxID=60893 RepID=A0A7V4G9J1_9BACT